MQVMAKLHRLQPLAIDDTTLISRTYSVTVSAKGGGEADEVRSSAVCDIEADDSIVIRTSLRIVWSHGLNLHESFSLCSVCLVDSRREQEKIVGDNKP